MPALIGKSANVDLMRYDFSFFLSPNPAILVAKTEEKLPDNTIMNEAKREGIEYSPVATAPARAASIWTSSRPDIEETILLTAIQPEKLKRFLYSPFPGFAFRKSVFIYISIKIPSTTNPAPNAQNAFETVSAPIR